MSECKHRMIMRDAPAARPYCFVCGEDLGPSYDDLRAENARLHEMYEAAEARHLAAIEPMYEAKAEVERLRKALRSVVAHTCATADDAFEAMSSAEPAPAPTLTPEVATCLHERLNPVNGNCALCGLDPVSALRSVVGAPTLTPEAVEKVREALEDASKSFGLLEGEGFNCWHIINKLDTALALLPRSEK